MTWVTNHIVALLQVQLFYMVKLTQMRQRYSHLSCRDVRCLPDPMEPSTPLTYVTEIRALFGGVEEVTLSPIIFPVFTFSKIRSNLQRHFS